MPGFVTIDVRREGHLEYTAMAIKYSVNPGMIHELRVSSDDIPRLQGFARRCSLRNLAFDALFFLC